MPYLNIETNGSLAPSKSESILKNLSTQIASLLGKPEDYVMVRIGFSPSMSFAGTTEACVFCILINLGLDDLQIPDLSQALTNAVSHALSIRPERIYLRFESPQRSHFAHNGNPFA